LCHPLMITHADIGFKLIKEYPCIEIIAEVKTTGKTGAEMEALNAVSTAALTIYDMCKGLEKGIIIGDISLLEKSGGKSGLWKPEFVKKGKVVNIAVGEKKGKDKIPVEKCEIIENFGLKGDAHAGGKKKQISIFAVESLNEVPENKMTEVMRGGYTENMTIVGIPLYYLIPGKILRVNSIEIEIESVGKETFVNDGRPYIVSRKGIFGHVKNSGIVKVGDTIVVVN
ncbi:MAG: molybdenum cofactor biosynthesis protein MoaC, partial [Proteobacteria bacterium]|nr:molybdenum cofactor biosynthesis protein MoaC [Pseudomonadota bacterium]